MRLITERRGYREFPCFEKIKYHKFLKSDYRLTELNTPASFYDLPRARFTAGGAAATYQFPFSTEKGGVTE
tara:strand:- start:49 stop:261 length:213 start_codon:yes stop_codon:yes gene_type:complete